MARTSQTLASVSLSSPKSSAAFGGSTRAAAAAGEDARVAWREVLVAVPPGPLGILLDSGATAAAAVLEGFAAVDARGTRGAVEAHGGVLPGSVLLRVNQYDLTEPGTTFADVGRVLRETSHLERELCFRVPEPAKPADESDDEQLLAGVSPASVELDDFEPVTQQAVASAAVSSVTVETHETAATTTTTTVVVTSTTQSAEPTPSPPLSTASSASSTATSKKPWTIGGFAVPSMPKSLPSLPKGLPSLPKSLPSIATVKAQFTNGGPGVSTMLFADTAVESQVAVAEEPVVVVVEAPAGPLGLNLDGGVPSRAVVVGFAPLPDGSSGALELHGGVTAGAVLVRVNGADVSRATLDEVRARLAELSGEPRTLEFRVPRAPTAKVATPRAAPVPLVEDLATRRKLEMALVAKHDKATIGRGECWFVLDVHWMNAWVAFVARGGPPPGPIANEVLLEDEWATRIESDGTGRPDTPRAGLALMKDYRCVTPMVWSLFVELHGRSNAPLLGRFKLDIDAEPVSEKEVTLILQPAHLRASVLVNELRDKCVTRA